MISFLFVFLLIASILLILLSFIVILFTSDSFIIIPPFFIIIFATSSHIWPGPNFGYKNCSIKEVSTFFWFISFLFLLNRKCFIAFEIDNPFILCAPHSAFISLHFTPHTFSV